MMTKRELGRSAIALAAASVLPLAGTRAFAVDDDTQQAGSLLIDDMSTPGRASYGGQWQLSTDRVMGGVSLGDARYVDEGGGEGSGAIHMTGQVSTANNGGFVQVSLRLRPQINASAYSGVEVRVKSAVARTYWVHLRDANSWRPWQVHNASFESSTSWSTVRVPFSSFDPYRAGQRRLDPRSLQRIGLVAGYEDFEADITFGSVGLYR